MNIHRDVIDAIDFVKQTYKIYSEEEPIEVFNRGNCGNLYSLLKMQFGDEVKPFGVYEYNQLIHVVSKIGEKYYDITGETTLEQYFRYLMEVKMRESVHFSSDIESYCIKEVTEEQVKEKSNNYKAKVSMKNFDKSTAVRTPSPEDSVMEKIEEIMKIRAKTVKQLAEDWDR